jgi:HrpA-like RNA helicase
MLETRLKALEAAVIQLTVVVDRLTEAFNTSLRENKIVIPQKQGEMKLKKITRARLMEKSEKYVRVFGENALDILLQSWGQKTVADINKDQVEPIYNQIVRELYEARQTTTR